MLTFHSLVHSVVHGLVAVPVVDIDGTLFVQGGIFLALLVILKPLLFTPWLEAQRRRTESIDGALTKATALRADADTLASDYDRRLADARDRALELRSRARRDEEATQAKELADQRAAASASLERERERLRGEAEKARGALAGRVDDLAEQITSKVLGRAS
jgi:F-type H+-transporting ATPase subunit b